jgi:hypothetical protein
VNGHRQGRSIVTAIRHYGASPPMRIEAAE